jgi:hypothetical protein
MKIHENQSLSAECRHQEPSSLLPSNTANLMAPLASAFKLLQVAPKLVDGLLF